MPNLTAIQEVQNPFEGMQIYVDDFIGVEVLRFRLLRIARKVVPKACA